MGARVGLSSKSIKGVMLYPPSMVPNSSVASAGVKMGELASPFAMAVKKLALT